MPRRLFAVLLCQFFGFGQAIQHKTTTVQAGGARIRIDEYKSRAAAIDAAALVLLYGSGGLQSSMVSFPDEAGLFATDGYSVYLPHYLDVTHGRADEPESHYELWSRTVRDVLEHIHSETGLARNRMAIAGYSLGGSIALAVAAQESLVAGVVVWSGSMPDAYRDIKTLPPLLILHGARDSVIPADNARQLAALCAIKRSRCDLNIYPDEGHAFSREAVVRANSQIRGFLNTILRAR